MTLKLALQGRVPAALEAARWMYVGEDGAWRVHAARTRFDGVPYLSIAPRVDRLRHELRRPYLDWLADLSSSNQSREWWTSELAARNVYTNLYTRLCALAAARETLAAGVPDDTLVVCSTPILLIELERAAAELSITTQRVTADAVPVRPTRARVRELRRVLADRWLTMASRRTLDASARCSRLRRYFETSPAYRRRVLDQRGVTVESFGGADAALIFTWVDQRSFDTNGRYRDPHFGALPDMLRENGLRIAYVVRVLESIPYSEAVDRLLDTGETVIFPDSLVGIDDWTACRAAAQTFEPDIPETSTVAGVPAARLAREHVDEYRGAHANPLTYDPLVRKLAAAGIRPARIFHTWEGHSWELGLAWSAQRHLPETVVVGYDNGNFTRFALSMCSSRREWEIRPYPHRVVTNGRLFHRLLVEEEFPPDRVRIGCAVRLSSLAPTLGLTSEPPGRHVRILVATSITVGESSELVERALEAFADDPRFELVVKPHPLVDVAAIRTAIGDLPRNARIATAPIPDLLRESDVVLYCYTLVCYEALAARVPPVFVKLETCLPIDQLEEHLDARWEARTAADLRAIVEKIALLDSHERAQWGRAAQAALDDALEPVTGNCIKAFVG